MPSGGVVAMYQSLGSPMAAPSIITGQLISPASNPWGAPNSDGVYTITSASTVTIRNCRILGTLVINAPAVLIDQPVLMQPHRADYPALIVTGDLTLAMDSAALLSEATAGVNFNPPGAPFGGASNATTTDSYPAELHGLVHAQGWLEFTHNTRIRGCVIAESSVSGVRVRAKPEVVYDPAMQTAPPMGYMKSVTMSVVPGTWTQVVVP
jgi:hypothetical protein